MKIIVRNIDCQLSRRIMYNFDNENINQIDKFHMEIWSSIDQQLKSFLFFEFEELYQK